MLTLCTLRGTTTMTTITCVYCPCSDPYHTEPFKALQDWTDHLDRMNELNKIFPGDHPAYYEPKKPLPLPERRAKSLPPVRGYDYSGNVPRRLNVKYDASWWVGGSGNDDDDDNITARVLFQ